MIRATAKQLAAAAALGEHSRIPLVVHHEQAPASFEPGPIVVTAFGQYPVRIEP